MVVSRLSLLFICVWVSYSMSYAHSDVYAEFGLDGRGTLPGTFESGLTVRLAGAAVFEVYGPYEYDPEVYDEFSETENGKKVYPVLTLVTPSCKKNITSIVDVYSDLFSVHVRSSPSSPGILRHLQRAMLTAGAVLVKELCDTLYPDDCRTNDIVQSGLISDVSKVYGPLVCDLTEIPVVYDETDHNIGANLRPIAKPWTCETYQLRSNCVSPGARSAYGNNTCYFARDDPVIAVALPMLPDDAIANGETETVAVIGTLTSLP